MHSDEAMAGRTGPPGVPVIPGFRRALYIYKYFTTFLLKYFCSCATITPNRLCSLPEQGKFCLLGKQAPGHDQEEVVFQHLRRHPFRCPGGHTGFFPGRAHRFHIISKKVKKMKGKWKNLLFLPSLLLLFASFFCPAVSPPPPKRPLLRSRPRRPPSSGNFRRTGSLERERMDHHRLLQRRQQP